MFAVVIPFVCVCVCCVRVSAHRLHEVSRLLLFTLLADFCFFEITTLLNERTAYRVASIAAHELNSIRVCVCVRIIKTGKSLNERA